MGVKTRSQSRQLRSNTMRDNRRGNRSGNRIDNRSGIRKQTSSKQIKIDPYVYPYKIKKIIGCYHTQDVREIKSNIAEELNKIYPLIFLIYLLLKLM